jgi:ribonuclease H2 subunit C
MEKEIFKNAGDQVEFHLLPCKIDYEGETQFKKYFVINNKTSTLRGRGLQGKDLDLDQKTVLIRKIGDQWRVEKKSSRTTIWCHDQEPSKENCSILNAKAWIQLSRSIHSD